MLKKTVSTLIVAAFAAVGATQVYAQKNYTDGGDLYGGSHTKKQASPNQNPAKSGKFDPYTDGAKQSTRSDLTNSGQKKFDPNTDGAKSGKFDPYTDGAKAGKYDPYTDGAKAPASQGNKAQ
ncbi:hypothetical protein ACIP1U_08605 [Cupriavidus sp. NPDC089707]|uniref:hypothetical protein n=1 Tax=Cupriavidus sp. NPDC089707 TaxID=3363963 RepID=UPI00381E3F2B